LADLHACAVAGNTEFFRARFAGKVVLFGAVLDVEDRKLTSQRFVNVPEHPASGARCVHLPMKSLFRADLVRNTTPGVYIHASAVDNLIGRDALTELDPAAGSLFVVALALAAAVIAMRLSAQLGAVVVAGGTAAWIAAATFAFTRGLAVPLIAPPLAAWLALALLLGYRFTVTDRDRRLLRSSFALYLAPTLVDRLLESDRAPELGGEQRRVTVLFSDVAGFTTLSEGIEPGELVALMNTYLTAMTEIVESEGGFVDKYIGDGIVAIFGAPIEDERHALHAVRAALSCQARLAELNRDAAAFRGRALSTRIGISTGPALVGNVGSRRRFNYTAMGDVVNLASRLEGANKTYGTRILASDATREEAGDEITWREIDRVTVVGREGPVTLFVPLTPEEGRATADYAAALAAYRAGRFGEAERLFEVLAPADPAARIMGARARRYASSPPPAGWDGVTPLESK
jgi:class 3 adenylate cyclase